MWDEEGRLVSVDVAGEHLSFGSSLTGGRSSAGAEALAAAFVDLGANPAVELDGQGQAVAGLLSGGRGPAVRAMHAGGTDAALRDVVGSPGWTSRWSDGGVAGPGTVHAGPALRNAGARVLWRFHGLRPTRDACPR